jgi:hypothetical protein
MIETYRLGGMKSFCLIPILLLFLSQRIAAQYDPSPTQGMRWQSFSCGVNSADFRALNFSYTYHQRGESALTSIKWDLSREFISSSNDSIASFFNKTSTLSLMVGDAWRGERIPWWIASGIGMSMNLRRYADFRPQSKTEWEKLTKFTMGIPAFVELGININDKWGMGLHGYGNWNFRQAYAGCNVMVSYRFKDKKIAAE